MITFIDMIPFVPLSHRQWLQEQVLPLNIAECVINMTMPIQWDNIELSDDKSVCYNHQAFDMDRVEQPYHSLYGFNRNKVCMTHILRINNKSVIITDSILFACIALADIISSYKHNEHSEDSKIELVSKLIDFFTIVHDHILGAEIIQKAIGGTFSILAAHELPPATESDAAIALHISNPRIDIRFGAVDNLVAYAFSDI